MGCHWGAPVLKSLMPDDWWDNIQSVQVDPHVPTKELDTLTWLQGDTGETMAAFTFGPFYRLRRSKLRAMLAQNIDIQYNKRLTNISYSEDGKTVTAHFTDSTTYTGSMLIGADGARSTTREILLGPTLATITRIPYAATFVQQKFTVEQALHLRSFHPLFLASAHPANNFAFFGMQDAADPNDPSSWTFFFYISFASSLSEQDATRDWTDAQRLKQQKELARGFCDPWKSAYEWTPDDSPVWYMGLTEWDPGALVQGESRRWDNHQGRVTLVGDACHPMTYQRGQGLNHSLMDAGRLRDALVKIKEVVGSETSGEQEGSEASRRKEKLIDEFEDEMIKRGGAEVRDGTANTTLLHDWEKVKQSPLFTKGMKKNDV